MLRINEENMRRLGEWALTVREQAQQAVEANGLAIQAAFVRFAEATRHAERTVTDDRP